MAIDFATEGLRLALPVERNCGILVKGYAELCVLRISAVNIFFFGCGIF
jgi:hypothetical protein